MATLRVRSLGATSHDVSFGHGVDDYLEGSAATAQRLRCMLLVILGEWFLDQDDGVPWWQPEGSGTAPIMGGPTDLGYAEAVITRRILACDGVKQLDAIKLTFLSSTRKLVVDANGQSVDGDPFSIRLEGP